MHETRDSLIKFLKATLKAQGLTLRSASKKIGRNDAYLQQFAGAKRSPETLPEDVRHDLAALLRIDDRQLRLASQKLDQSTKLPQDNLVYEALNDRGGLHSVSSKKEIPNMGESVGNEAILKDLMIQMRDISTRMTRIEGAVFSTDPGVVPNKSGPPSRRKA